MQRIIQLRKLAGKHRKGINEISTKLVIYFCLKKELFILLYLLISIKVI